MRPLASQVCGNVLMPAAPPPITPTRTLPADLRAMVLVILLLFYCVSIACASGSQMTSDELLKLLKLRFSGQK